MPVKIRRKDQLLKKLSALHPALFEAVAESNRQAADEMADLAKSFVPVKTGKLRDSIVVTGPGQQTPSYSQGGGDMVPEGAYAVSAGNSATRYAHLVEFGTKGHINAGKFAMTENPGAKPQPFFWPAYRMIRKRHKGRVGRMIGKALKSIAGR